MARESTLIVGLLVAASGATFFALHLGMHVEPGEFVARGTAARLASTGVADRPEPVPSPAKEPTPANVDAGDDSGEAGNVGVRIAAGPTFVKVSGTTWDEVEPAVSRSIRRVRAAYARCLTTEDTDRSARPATGTLDLRFDETESARPARVQVFGPDFAAAPVAHQCLKKALYKTAWSVPPGASIRFRVVFEYE